MCVFVLFLIKFGRSAENPIQLEISFSFVLGEVGVWVERKRERERGSMCSCVYVCFRKRLNQVWREFDRVEKR